MIGLVETKHSELSVWDLRNCWGHHGSDFMHVTTVQGSGGLCCHGIKYVQYGGI